MDQSEALTENLVVSDAKGKSVEIEKVLQYIKLIEDSDIPDSECVV